MERGSAAPVACLQVHPCERPSQEGPSRAPGWGRSSCQYLQYHSQLDQPIYIHITGYMEPEAAIEVFAALAQPTRLSVFRRLMEHQPEGLPAGEVARLLEVPQNTMSSHLAILARAGLVESERRGRTIFYRPVIDRVREVASFLVRDCCGGRPELCEPLIAEFTPCCSPKEASHA